MQCRTEYCRGNILLARNLKNEAKEAHEQALKVRIQCMTEIHPYTACSFWKLATLWEEDDWIKAM